MYSMLRRKSQDALDRLWIRIAVISVLNLAAIGIARLVRPYLPERIADTLGTESLNDLLTIIASSMLAVVTFSLSVMVSVYRSASSQWTPRVHRLMLEDRTTQNTLATFVGAYIFALAAIVLLRTSLFVDEDDDEDPQVVLFFFTIVVLVLIVVSMVRWILHLQRVGSLTDVARRIEKRTQESLDQRLAVPWLGGHRLGDLPSGAYPVRSTSVGYLREVDLERIVDASDAHDVEVYLQVSVGAFVHRGQVLCSLSRRVDDIVETIRDSSVIGDLRNFDQDPRFGLTVLGEIAIKALSSGVNDPGTAIDVIGRLARIVDSFFSETARQDGVRHERLFVPSLTADDVTYAAFDAIARDEGAPFEVRAALQRALGFLAEHEDPSLARSSATIAADALRRAERTLDDDDVERLRSACR